MASIVVNGDTSGAVTLSAPAVAGTVTVTLPAASGTMLTTASTINSVPQVTRYTSGSGTYTVPTGARYLIVEMIGGGSGGGGGGGNGSNFGTIAGGSGTASTFGTSLLTANGATNGNGLGNGGSVTVNSPAISIVALQGGYGLGWQYNFGSATALPDVMGAATPFGSSGYTAIANTGVGGMGGLISNTGGFSGNGGGAGGYIKAQINSPSATYAYSVGTGGSAGTAVGAGNGNGLAGGSGVVIVTAYF